MDHHEPCVQQAVEWLRMMQNPDGGWGETCGSYDDPNIKGVGPSTASQTAWAVMGLLAANDTAQRFAAARHRLPAEDAAARRFVGRRRCTPARVSRACSTSMYYMYRQYFPLLALTDLREGYGGTAEKSRCRICASDPSGRTEGSSSQHGYRPRASSDAVAVRDMTPTHIRHEMFRHRRDRISGKPRSAATACAAAPICDCWCGRPAGPTTSPILPAERVVGDLRDLESLKRGMSGCEFVFHVAADYRLWAREWTGTVPVERRRHAQHPAGGERIRRAAGYLHQQRCHHGLRQQRPHHRREFAGQRWRT